MPTPSTSSAPTTLLNECSNKGSLDWVMFQLAFNDSQLKNGKVSFPNLQIGDHIWGRTAFSFHTGEVSVQIEELNDFSHYVHFSESDWYDFLKVEFLILPILRIAEGQSVFSLEQYLQLHPNKFKWDQINTSKLVMFVNSKILVSIQMPNPDVRHPHVEFRYHTPPGEEEILLGLPYKLSSNKVLFSSGLYDFFSRFVILKLSQSCQCWKLMNHQFSRVMKELTAQPPHFCPLFARNPFDF